MLMGITAAALVNKTYDGGWIDYNEGSIFSPLSYVH